MKRLLTSRQMQETDRYTIQQKNMPSMVLMEKAAEAVLKRLLEGPADLKRVLVVCGSGNNGADGMAVARMLTQRHIDADLYEVGNPAHFSPEAAMQWEIAEKYHTKIVNNPSWPEYTTIVDAVFGTGLSREVAGIYADCIEKMNHTQAYIVSVDIPSGINGTTGQVLKHAVRADETVTFAFCKPGQILFPGASYTGKLYPEDVGIYECEKGYEENLFLPEKEDILPLRKRREDGNKGTFGKGLLIAGSADIYGAAYMSALAALKTGIGMVKILTAEKQISSLNLALPEAMTASLDGDDFIQVLDESIKWADCIAVGPGLGTGKRAAEVLLHVLETADRPLVLDADALNLLAGRPDALCAYRGEVIITPHIGEMSRLTGKTPLELKTAPVTEAGNFAQKNHVVVVLKDARTVIALPDGTVYINQYGNSGMATAGSGDVLTGIILGRLGIERKAGDAAWQGVLLHACAGDAAAEELGESSLMATDICRYLYETGNRR